MRGHPHSVKPKLQNSDSAGREERLMLPRIAYSANGLLSDAHPAPPGLQEAVVIQFPPNDNLPPTPTHPGTVPKDDR
jgi:hypothetical protein